MGAIEWITVTVIASAVVAIVVTYWVLDREMENTQERIIELERELHFRNLDSIIDSIEKDPPHSRHAQTRVPRRR